MTAVLGVSAYYHDSAAALIVDGEVVAAAQEERFTRRKHDGSFPVHAIRYCLESADLVAADLAHVAFYEKPLLRFERLLETYLAIAPRGFASFRRALPIWLRTKVHLSREMRAYLPGFERRFLFLHHHRSHAASAFLPSPFERAGILTLDGVGEWATGTIGLGEGNRIKLVREQRFPHSVGLFYSAMTSFAGFRVNSGEYKLMGLAPFGEPRFVDKLKNEVVHVRDDGSVWLDMSYFDYLGGVRMHSPKLESLLEGPALGLAREPTQREMDIAASAQAIVEEAVLKSAHFVHRETGAEALCMAGGVALNSVANGRLVREGPFEHVWVQPAAGDAGGALGAALFTWHQLLGQPRAPRADALQGALLGPAYDESRVDAAIGKAGLCPEVLSSEGLLERVAQRLSDQAVVGWFQGRMEFGPRALGARSILADPRSPTMQSTLNQKIKLRESFRPFAPVVLEEKASDWFDLGGLSRSPYMLFVCQSSSPPGREPLPAVTHVDKSARLQTVGASAPQLRLRSLLEEFERLSGVPVLVNTSFNVRGQPIVCTPEDALECFLGTDMDVLVIGDRMLEKSAQPPALVAGAHDALAQYANVERAADDAENATLLDSSREITPEVVRRFGMVWCPLVLGVLVALRVVPAVVIAFAFLSVALTWAWPTSMRALLRVWALLTRPVAALVSRVLLALVYFFVFAPLGALARVAGHDPMQKKKRNAPSAWRSVPEEPPPKSYFDSF